MEIAIPNEIWAGTQTKPYHAEIAIWVEVGGRVGGKVWRNNKRCLQNDAAFSLGVRKRSSFIAIIPLRVGIVIYLFLLMC